MGSQKVYSFIALLLLGGLFARNVAALAAQEANPETVRVTGIVRTAGNLPVPGATLRVMRTESGQGWVSWTDENGKFVLPGLPPGHYRFEAQQLGFEPASVELDVKGNAPAEIEIKLRIVPFRAEPPRTEKPSQTVPQPGAPQPAPQRSAQTPPGNQRAQAAAEATRQRNGSRFQEVDLSGQANGTAQETPAPTENSALGEASSSDAFLISGTVGRTAGSGGEMMPGGFGYGGMGGFGGGFPGAPGGMPEGGNIGMMPGGPSGMPGPGGRGGQPARVPQPQGQGQRGAGTQAQRGAPQQGGFGQGIEGLWGMQRILRLAANRLRISFFNRYSNSIWNARPYSLTAPDPAKIASYTENFGVNIGGPLRIPKVYDGRDKTFFFVNYQLGRNRNPVDTFATVPLPGERHGDFTTRGVQLFDPASNLNGPRTPLGSVIPAGMLNSAAVGLLQFVPDPNLPGLVQNYHLQTRVPASTDTFNVRVLHTISPKLNLQVMYGLNSSRTQSVQNFLALRGKQSVLGQNLNIGLTQQYSQRWIHDSRISWSRSCSNSMNAFAFVNDVAGSLGITGISTAPINYGVPQIGFTNFTDLSDPVPALRRNQTFRYMDNVSYMRGKHTLRAGGEVRRLQTNTQNDPTARGAFTFSGLMTSQLDAQGRPIPGTGFDFADFLLGLPQFTTVRFGSSRTYFRSWGINLYAQDDWRIHPRFTLTYGLRYEIATPPIELFNKIANLDINSSITAVAVVVPGQPAPFSGSLPRSLIRTDYNNWAPRLAIAWRPPLRLGRGRSMTVRAGYSVFYNSSIYSQLSASMANQPPWAQAQTRLTSATSLLTLQNGFPPQPPGSVPNTIAVDPNYRVGYAQLWNLSAETQLAQNFTFELTYTGTKGTHLDLLRAPNRALPAGPLSTEFTRRIPNAPGFTYDTSGASSIYHALQVRVQRRMSHGLMVMGTYTYGKSLDNASSIGGGAQVVVQDDGNFRAERGLSSFDIRHQFRASYAWELPFGERKRWAKRGWQASAFGNLQFSGVVIVSSGTPFTARVLGNLSNNSGTGNNFSERPDQVGDPSLMGMLRTPMHFFNTAAFAPPPAGRFGDAARNTIAGPGQVTFNLSLGKSIRFGKDNQRRLDLRWEAQNLLNTPNFTGLGTVVNAANYGRVLGARAMRTMDLQVRVNF